MRMKEYQVSIEYLETLCEWMIEWAEKEDSLIFPQFLTKRGIGYSYFNYFRHICPRVNNIYEVIISKLCTKWLRIGMTTKDMPQHQQKLLSRYIRIYDQLAFETETEARKIVAEAKTQKECEFFAENYSKQKLDGVYKEIYDKNDNKRRDSEKAE
jgi:hypothetical protein